jgi:bacterial/archaeal transporter family protein
MSWLSWALLSALFAALTALLAKLGVREVDPTLATAIRTSVVAVFSWAAVGFISGPVQLAGISWRAWVFLLSSGVATAISWLFYFHALNAGPLTRVAPVDKLSVVLTVLLGVLILGEAPTAKVITGAIFITIGVAIIALD